MRHHRRTLMLGAFAVVVGALAIGGAAIAAGGNSATTGDLTRLAAALRAKDAFTDAVAKSLGTNAAALRLTLADAARDRIDAAEKAGTLSSADADTIKAALADDPRLALRVAQAADVAKRLGVTEAKLNEAWNDAVKAQALARVDQAVKDGWITEKAAAEMRARIEAATLPGFGFGGGPGLRGGHGFGEDGPGVQRHGLFGRGFRGPGGLPLPVPGTPTGAAAPQDGLPV